MTKGIQSRHTRLLIGLVATLGLLAAACGDGGGVKVGDAGPGFSLAEAAGGSVTLDGYEGRDVLLYFHMADG